MGYDTGIANRLRAAGLRVVEVSGWTTRGSSSFGPGGSVNHHTAGGASGATPSLNTCIYGRPDLDGPLCNVMQSRESGEHNDIAYVIAAGRANHAGEGGWKGLSGNSSVYGLEIEHTGTDPLPMHRQEIAARIHAAMWQGDASMVCQHFEWTSRKIDAAEGVDPNNFRNMVASGGDDMPLSDSDISRIVAAVEDRLEVHLGERAVSNPNAWLNSGIAARIKMDRNAAIKAQFGVDAVNNPNAALNSGVSHRIELDRQRDLNAQTEKLIDELGG